MTLIQALRGLFRRRGDEAAVTAPAGPVLPHDVVLIAGGKSAAPVAPGARFAACLEAVLAEEGGFSAHPADNGGATNMGITHLTLAAWRRLPAVTADDVRALSVDEARAIYRAQYWNACRCDDLPPGVDHAVFDWAVHGGPVRAVRGLQRVVGVSADGAVGPQTLVAVRSMPADRVVDNLCAARMSHLRGLDDWKVFGRGWSARVARVQAEALGAVVDL